MKVFNLACGDGHSFEGWFGSTADYEQQRDRGLLTCPVCENRDVRRTPSAPRLNLGGHRDEAPPAGRTSSESASPAASPSSRVAPTSVAAPAVDPATAAMRQAQAALLALTRKIVAGTDDVGDRFAEEARRIHYGEVPERAIRGRATREQAEELRDEGIDVVPLPFPGVTGNDLQ